MSWLWWSVVPWTDQRQIEQDLIIGRAVVEIASDEMLRDALRLRGGMALNKLHFQVSLRQSEDVDLVRTSAGPIGLILDRLRVGLESWLGTAQFDQSPVAPKLRFRAEAEEGSGVPIRLEMRDGGGAALAGGGLLREAQVTLPPEAPALPLGGAAAAGSRDLQRDHVAADGDDAAWAVGAVHRPRAGISAGVRRQQRLASPRHPRCGERPGGRVGGLPGAEARSSLGRPIHGAWLRYADQGHVGTSSPSGVCRPARGGGMTGEPIVQMALSLLRRVGSRRNLLSGDSGGTS